MQTLVVLNQIKFRWSRVNCNVGRCSTKYMSFSSSPESRSKCSSNTSLIWATFNIIKSRYTSPNSPWAVLKKSEINSRYFRLKCPSCWNGRSYFDPSQAQYMDKILKKRWSPASTIQRLPPTQGKLESSGYKTSLVGSLSAREPFIIEVTLFRE